MQVVSVAQQFAFDENDDVAVLVSPSTSSPEYPLELQSRLFIKSRKCSNAKLPGATEKTRKFHVVPLAALEGDGIWANLSANYSSSVTLVIIS